MHYGKVISMNVLILTAYYTPGFKGGGPIKTIKNISEKLSSTEIKFDLITSDRDLGDEISYSDVDIGKWNSNGNLNVFYSSHGLKGIIQLYDVVNSKLYDVIYINSFFSFRYSIYPQILALFNGKTVIVAPRGEFSPGAFRVRNLKKRLYVSLYKLFGMHRRIIFQASSTYESSDIQNTLGHVNVQIAENIGSCEFVDSFPLKSETSMRIVFFSRISPKKNLLEAIAILQKVNSAVDFHIFGPIEDSEYWVKCEELIEDLPSHIEVSYKGSMHPNNVIKTISKYDMFFMPTLGENYGHVIAEAFCAGLPVLISDTTPWRQLDKKGIGWDIPLSEPERFAQVIDEFTTLTQEEYQTKRQRVLDWAKHKFSQRDAIEANIAMFKYAYEKSRKQ